MDAIELLLRDHAEIRDLFREFKGADQAKETIKERLINKIKMHSRLEERVFYPAVREKADPKTRDLVLEGIEEHRLADFVMERLHESHPGDEKYEPRFKVLTETLGHHLEEEEGELFPKAGKLLSKDLETLGKEMEELEKKLGGE